MNPLVREEVQGKIVLASRSPRRVDLLTKLGFVFDVVPPADHIEDEVTVVNPGEFAVECARRKAAHVAKEHRGAVVIGADTVVTIDGRILGKPNDDDEAAEFLRGLAGRTHAVITGVAARWDNRERFGSERTEVRFRNLTDLEIESYVASGEGRDKAGAYAVQGHGAALVGAVEGCYHNVVGLPTSLLIDLLNEL